MKLILALLFVATSSITVIGAADTYTDETLRILHDRRANGEFGGLQLQELSKADCNALYGNVTMGGATPDQKSFVKDCTGSSISILQQVEAPELPMFVDAAIVTYINYGNLPYAVSNTSDFFANGNFFFDGIVQMASEVGCKNFETMRDERVEITSRFMVNEIIAYDVRVTYKEMGIISIRYFLTGEIDRHDYNYTCE